MNKLDAQRQQEIQQAEELLLRGPRRWGLRKEFPRAFRVGLLMPYPRIPEAKQGELDQTLTELRKFLNAVSILRSRSSAEFRAPLSTG